MTKAEDLWEAWNELNDYALKEKDDALYDALVEVADALEELVGGQE